MSDPSGNAICQYYFNDINANNNILNSKTSVYDLSLVNVGTASFPTINPVSKVGLLTPSLYQNTDSTLNYSYYTSNASNTSINNLTGSFSISFWTYRRFEPYSYIGMVWCLSNSDNTRLITFSQRSALSEGNSVNDSVLSISIPGNSSYTGSTLNGTDAYNHYVLTCSTSGGTNTITLYQNKVKLSFPGSNQGGYGANPTKNDDIITLTGGDLFSGTGNKLYVLGGPNPPNLTWPADSGSKSRGFNGHLGQLTIYNKALSTSEINYLYSTPYVPPSPPPPPPCFKQGSKILKFDTITNVESYVPVETLRKCDLIKTFISGYKPISIIGYKTLENPADAPDVRDRLYGLSPKEINADSETDEPLYLTGRHSVLRNDLSEDDLRIVRKYMGDVYVTENHYRVPIWLDGRAKPYTDNNPVTIWHFSLENENIYQNYGVMANGILVESSSIEYMTEHSNMELLQ